ncbi:uncharacterized protein C17orf67 homolog [Pongo abelii]|uniref:uncharacterized protein C17orf67 homolog n=1 Tax=Pongo abelii TaxID=9601 RepID=UPI003006B38B
MKTLPVLVLSLTLLTVFSETSPILTEKQAKQLLRSRRRDGPSKPGFPASQCGPRTAAHRCPFAWEEGGMDAPCCEFGCQYCEYMHHLLALEHRAEEQFLEHWLNPHCKPHCDRNRVHLV